MSKELDVSVDDILAAFPESGSNINNTRMSYPYLIILQSDKTLDIFEDGDTMTKQLFGKLFIRTNDGLHSRLLRDTFTGVILKEQKGAECWAEVDGKTQLVEWNSSRSWSKDEKDEINKRFGVKGNETPAKNVVKVLIKLDESFVTTTGTEIKYAIITVKGASYSPYIEQVSNTIDSLSKSEEELRSIYARSGFVPRAFFKLTIGSKKYEDAKNPYYAFDFKVDVQSASEAMRYSDELAKALKFDLITNKPVDDSYEIAETSPDLHSITMKQINESMKPNNVIDTSVTPIIPAKPQTTTVEEVDDIDDLPFG